MRYDPAVVKKESEAAIAALGGRVNEYLPWIDPAETKPRGSLEVANRALILGALVHISFEAPIGVIRSWLETHELVGLLSEQEAKVVLADMEPDATTKQRLRWNIEPLWAAAWAGGFADDLGPSTPIGGQLATILPDLRINESPDRFVSSFHLRSAEQLLAKLDLLYRAHWAARDSRLTGAADCPFNEGIVHERRRLLEWSLNAAAHWDDVDMST